MEQSKPKECKTCYHKKSPNTSIVYDSLILELSISINISTALLAWRQRKIQTSFKTLVSKKTTNDKLPPVIPWNKKHSLNQAASVT